MEPLSAPVGKAVHAARLPQLLLHRHAHASARRREETESPQRAVLADGRKAVDKRSAPVVDMSVDYPLTGTRLKVTRVLASTYYT